MDGSLQQTLEQESPFHLRQAVERLREGLFDPVAVRLLTAHEAQLQRSIDKTIKQMNPWTPVEDSRPQVEDSSKPAHLMICGDYGQGKSHSLAYIRDKALQQGFAVSRVNLDIREVPMNNFRQVYHALVTDLFFPEKEPLANSKKPSADKTKGPSNALNIHWRQWVKQQSFQQAQDILDFLPDTMPHFFRCVLTALTQKNITLDKKQKNLKKHAQFRPKEYPYLLNMALSGAVVPLVRLRHAIKYRQVPDYTKQSLTCKGNQPYLDMIKGIGWLIQKMGYRGWVILFDEAESISQLQIRARAQSYQLLQQLLCTKSSHQGIIPVLAVTDDFFTQLRQEDYAKTRFRKEVEIPYFLQNYAETLKHLTLYRLHDLSVKEWELLIEKLVQLYCQAYHWKTSNSELQSLLANYLQSIRNKETRLKLKALVNELDLAHQTSLWNN